MSKQIFKQVVPIVFFYEFLEKICEKENNHNYIFDIHAYKKILFYNYQTNFLKELTKYYYVSKRFYLEREFNYNSIATILRQIAKSHNLNITSKMKYSDSNYIIEYSIPISELPNEK
jgi:hypothetical protein